MSEGKYEDEIIEEENREIGENIIEFLKLKKKENGRVSTAWGDKTPLGLALSIQRIIEEGL